MLYLSYPLVVINDIKQNDLLDAMLGVTQQHTIKVQVSEII